MVDYFKSSFKTFEFPIRASISPKISMKSSYRILNTSKQTKKTIVILPLVRLHLTSKEKKCIFGRHIAPRGRRFV